MDKRTENLIGRILIGTGLGLFAWRVTPEDTKRTIKAELKEAFRLALEAPPQQPLALPPPQNQTVRPKQELLQTETSQPSQPHLSSDFSLATMLRNLNVIYITGKRGSGKSLLAMRLLELMRLCRRCFIVGMPETGKQLLPDWIGTVETVEDLPNNCVAVIDEAYLFFNALERGGKISADRAKLLNLTRQRSQILIFIAQDGRQIDRYVIQAADAFLIKRPAPLQPLLDRPELRPVLELASEAFGAATNDQRSIVFASVPESEFVGLVQIETPPFWSSALSVAYGQAALDEQLVNPTSNAPAEETAARLRRQGLSYREIAKALGVSKSTAYNLVNGYPYLQP